MKKSASFVLFIIASLLAVTSFAEAKTAPGFYLMPGEQGKIRIMCINMSTPVISVKISGENGLVHEESFTASNAMHGFTRVYDLSNLKPGVYDLQISDGQITTSFRIEHRKDHTIWAKYWDSMLNTREALVN